ncbi:MAG: HdeD family acid-resistance protein [Candidatus Limnocylindria bacterium]
MRRRARAPSMFGEIFGEITGIWWLFLITGIAWVIIALIVLRFDTTSIATVGVLLGVVFLLAGLNEFMISIVRRTWRWAHIVLGVIFLIGAIAAFATPYDAFWALASILGFLLVLKGSLDIIASAMTKDVNELWGLGLLAGILELILGFWASQQFFPARAALILIWVGFMALFRGVSEIVLAFQIRRLQAATT